MTVAIKYALCSQCPEAYPIDDSGMRVCQVCGGELFFLSPCCQAQFTRKNATRCPVCGEKVRDVTQQTA